MSREIKFRAWDKSRGRFQFGCCNLMLTLGGLMMWQFGYDPPFPVNQDDFVLQQFTGLHDKNGKPIFEGDILKSHHFGRGRGTHYLYHSVKWSDKYAGWLACGRDGENEPGSVQLWVYLRNIQCEVIGNVFENPELLEGEE